MKVDVSEIKTFKTCKRQWQLSSRNKFHLRLKETPPAFVFGTLFHEALASLYLCASLDSVLNFVCKETQDDSNIALLAMIKGYYKEVLPGDLDRFKVLDIEHHFEIAPRTSDGEYLFPMQHKVDKQTGEYLYNADGKPIMESSLLVCGSIDMIVLDVEQNKIYGFEHKTCKNFRDESYLWMDEQPRVYTWALQQYVKEYNERIHRDWEIKVTEMRLQYEEDCARACCDVALPDYPDEPIPATLGGVYLNEVKKLLRQFQYKRTLCAYTEEDMDNFMNTFFQDCTSCKHAVDNNSYASPEPSYMNCSMCNFKTICSTYMYNNLNKKEVLDEFCEEFVEREEDHLEEKVERSGNNE